MSSLKLEGFEERIMSWGKSRDYLRLPHIEASPKIMIKSKYVLVWKRISIIIQQFWNNLDLFEIYSTKGIMHYTFLFFWRVLHSDMTRFYTLNTKLKFRRRKAYILYSNLKEKFSFKFLFKLCNHIFNILQISNRFPSIICWIIKVLPLH